jgi:Lrp/AsnC family transcriptional regulator, leucine-responsive regulatory protein
MKNLSPGIIALLKRGSCTPKISAIARRTKEPGATIHYNIRKLEKDRSIIGYKAVFDHKRIGEGFCSYVLINLSPDEYGDPDRVGMELAKHPEVESVDIITGDWELVLKIRTKDQDAYYEFVKKVISRKGVTRIKTLISLKQLKSEFMAL